MRPLYRKLNYLLTQTAPDYKGTRMRGSFCRLTIGSLIQRTPGFFSSVSIKWDKQYPWEIAVNEPEGENKGKTPDDDGIQLLPHILNVNCKFTPVHNFIPKKSITQSPFILPRKYADKGVAANFKEANTGRQQQTVLPEITIAEPKAVKPTPRIDLRQLETEPTKIDTSKLVKKDFKLAEETIRLPKKQLTTDTFKKAQADYELRKAIEFSGGPTDNDTSNLA